MTPFYRKALALFTRTQEQQIAKGLAKYPEPFNPHSWTPEELLNHALEETVDLTHYLVGLKDQIDVLVYENRVLTNQVRDLKMELGHFERPEKTVRNLKEELSTEDFLKLKETKYDMNFNPHFDTDDQY